MRSRCVVLNVALFLAACDVDAPEVDTAESHVTGVGVGTEHALDVALTGVPTGFASRGGNVAFSGAQFLAVWQDLRTTPSAIFATRLSPLAAVTDTAGLRISPTTATGEQAEPFVAFMGTRYIVVWEDRGLGDLRAASVTTAGVVTQLGSFGTAAADTRPRIATVGSEVFVVFQAGPTVHGALLAGSSFGTPFAIATGTEPALAANPAGGYLVTYTTGVAPQRKLEGRRVAPTSATPLATPAFAIGNGYREQHQSDVSFVGGNFVTVWLAGGRIAGTRIDPVTEALLDTHLENGVPKGGIDLTAESTDTPKIACATTATCLLAWRRRVYNTTDVTDVETRLLGPDLLGVPSVALLSGGIATQSTPQLVAAGAGTYLATYFDTRHGNDGSVYAARLSSTGLVLDPAGVMLSRGRNYEGSAAIARAGQRWLVTWTDSRTLGNNILGARVNNGGQSQDATAITVGGAPFGQGDAAVAGSGTNYFAVWSDRRGQQSDVYGTLVTANGVVASVAGLPITTATEDQVRPRVAVSNAGTYLVVWQDRRNLATATRVDIYGALVGAAGTVVTADIPVTTAAGEQLYPTLAYDRVQNLYLVAWIDTPTGAILGTRVTATGTVLDASPVQLAAGGSTKTDLALAFGTTGFALAWRDGASTIRAARARVTASALTVLDPSGITVATGAQVRKSPTIAFMNDVAGRFLVVWADTRNAATSGYDLHANAFTEATGMLELESIIANTATDEIGPALSPGVRTTGASVEGLLGYQRYDATAGTYRLMTRKLSF